MSKHAVSQYKADTLNVGDTVSTPGMTGMVLAKGRVEPAGNASYAGVVLLTTVDGNDYEPFRIANFYFDDDSRRWQSGNGAGFSSLTMSVKSFNNLTGGAA